MMSLAMHDLVSVQIRPCVCEDYEKNILFHILFQFLNKILLETRSLEHE